MAGWLVGLTPGVESKTRENKNTYPAIGATSFRTFYSSQLDLFMRPAAAFVVGWGRRRRKRRRRRSGSREDQVETAAGCRCRVAR